MGEVVAAEQALREVLLSVAKEHKWDADSIQVTPASSGGANYTSTLFIASATATSGREDKLFAKVAIIGEKMREGGADHLFQVEKYVYKDLLKTYTKIEDEHNLADEHRIKFPKIYAFGSQEAKETVVMEDLTVQGYGSLNRMTPVSWEYASRAIEELAKWHALSLAYEAHQPEEFAKASEYLKFQVPKESPEAAQFFETIIQGIMGAVRTDLLPAVQSYLPKAMDAYNIWNMPGARTVLVHGDYRVSNLLHRRRDGKLQIVPVDYQTIHSGNPASDILYLIFTGTDKEFRKLHYKNLIDFYYKQLGQCLERLGLNVATLYPRQVFDDDLKHVLGHVMIITIIVLPIVLVDEENAPKMSGDMADFAIKPNKAYTERLNGIIEDLVEWGAL